MDTMRAFAMGEVSRNNPKKVFDWDKAARIIVEREASSASAGLIEDWEYTGGPILGEGKPLDPDDTYTYLASTWATPTLIVEDDVVECWRYEIENDPWGAKTYWPDSARKIHARKEF